MEVGDTFCRRNLGFPLSEIKASHFLLGLLILKGKMGTEVLKIYIVLAIILVVLLGAGFYYVFNESLPDLPVASNTSPSSPETNQQTTNGEISPKPQGILEDIEALAQGKIQIIKSGKNKITITWEHLPEGTDRIVLFRENSRGGGAWVRWKTIPIGSNAGGSVSITLNGEDISAYSFYAQAFSPNGYTLWASPTIHAEEPPAPPLPIQNTTGTTTSTGQIAQGQNPPGTQGNSSPTSSTPSPTPSSTTPNPISNSTPTSTSGNTTTTSNIPPPAGPPVAYYTPDGQIAGYYYPHLDPFWVLHVNQNIEIGWQNLPPPTTSIVVYRSSNQVGPWKELMRQQNPSTSTTDFVRLIDYTLADSYYYRMDALSETNIIAAYEPIFLEGITQ